MILGGIGLFLLGMALLTDGLQAAAGNRLRQALRRYTRTRLSSVMAGAASTAAMQSSSATTLLTIGFVGAGLLPLAAALGVVFGANVGTTVTAWIVAAVGLKVKMSTFALPLVGIGALVRLFTRGKRAALGSAVAGFGLVFVGIDVLQNGMQSASERIDLARFAGDEPLTLFVLVLVGAGMTVVMQSSSAAVATTLAAVDGGTIGLVQAAALVIGQNVGTTVTAGIGAIGGSAAVRRTAFAHMIFNVVTGLLATGLLPVMGPLAGERFAQRDPAIVISAFHTAFNVLGVLLFIPFTGKLAAWLERRIPERGAELTRRLATGRSTGSSAVLEACHATAQEIAKAAFGVATGMLSNNAPEAASERRLEAIHNALDALRNKLNALHANTKATDEHRQHVALLHALDHLYRLEQALGESHQAAVCRNHQAAAVLVSPLCEHFEILHSWDDNRAERPPSSEAVTAALAAARRSGRPQILEETAKGKIPPETSEQLLEAIRWLDRLGYHSARARYHLEEADPHAEAAAGFADNHRPDEGYDMQA